MCSSDLQDFQIQQILGFIKDLNHRTGGINDEDALSSQDFFIRYSESLCWDQIKNLTKGNVKKLTQSEQNSIIDKIYSYEEMRNYFYSDSFKEELDRVIAQMSDFHLNSIDSKNEIIHPSQELNISWFRRLINWIIGKKNKPETSFNHEIKKETNNNVNEIINIDDSWYLLKTIKQLRCDHQSFLQKYNEICLERNRILTEIENFNLFNHDRSKCTIDEKKLQDFYISNKDSLMAQIIKYDDEQDIYLVYKNIKEIIAQFENNWSSLDLVNPYSFISINENNLSDILNYIHIRSIPFANLDISECENYSNKITRMIYSENKYLNEWFDKNSDQVTDSKYMIVKNSKYIKNKICMFQFLIIDDYLDCLIDLKK